MARLVVSLLCGGVFGAGLLLSGMTDTLKVQGWLDVFGNWDATLAFVMGGAILPMAVAWRVAAHRHASILGFPLPERPQRDVGPNLVAGSVLFGMGWALTGLCPGPTQSEVRTRAGSGRSKLANRGQVPSRPVAEAGVAAMFAGKRLVIPGAKNRFETSIPRLLPRAMMAGIVHNTQAAK